MFFVYRRATTRELFALHEEQGRNVLVSGDVQDNDYKLAAGTPGFGGLRDGTNGAGVSDAGIRWWMVFFDVPTSQWPAGI